MISNTVLSDHFETVLFRICQPGFSPEDDGRHDRRRDQVVLELLHPRGLDKRPDFSGWDGGRQDHVRPAAQLRAVGLGGGQGPRRRPQGTRPGAAQGLEEEIYERFDDPIQNRSVKAFETSLYSSPLVGHVQRLPPRTF